MSGNLFVLPAGLDIEIGETVTLRYDGDVRLEQSFGRPLGEVRATGDLTIALDHIQGRLHAGGILTLEGRIEAEILHGREVHIGKTDVKCRSISADERIVIGGAKLAVDIIIAPEIVFDTKANGRVTIIEAHNEFGPTKIKGGFSLAEYEEAVGDLASFLEERGLTQLVTAMGGITQPEPEESDEAAADPDSEHDVPVAPIPPPRADVTARTTMRSVPPEPLANAPTPFPAEEDVSDPLSLSIDDLERLPEPEKVDELHPKLTDAVKRIAASYEGKELPPAVEQLRILVEARDYDKLRENITEVWNALLGFHQKKGIRPHHQVTHAFNVIHGLVQQG